MDAVTRAELVTAALGGDDTALTELLDLRRSHAPELSPRDDSTPCMKLRRRRFNRVISCFRNAVASSKMYDAEVDSKVALNEFFDFALEQQAGQSMDAVVDCFFCSEEDDVLEGSSRRALVVAAEELLKDHHPTLPTPDRAFEAAIDMVLRCGRHRNVKELQIFFTNTVRLAKARGAPPSAMDSPMKSAPLVNKMLSTLPIPEEDMLEAFGKQFSDEADVLWATETFREYREWRAQREAALAERIHAASERAAAMLHFMVGWRDASDYSLLHHMVVMGSREIAVELLRLRADVNAQTRAGQTPLHLACAAGDSDLVYVLVRYSARLDIKDHHGQTPIATAESTDHGHIASALRGEQSKRARNLLMQQSRRRHTDWAARNAPKRRLPNVGVTMQAQRTPTPSPRPGARRELSGRNTPPHATSPWRPPLKMINVKTHIWNDGAVGMQTPDMCRRTPDGASEHDVLGGSTLTNDLFHHMEQDAIAHLTAPPQRALPAPDDTARLLQQVEQLEECARSGIAMREADMWEVVGARVVESDPYRYARQSTLPFNTGATPVPPSPPTNSHSPHSPGSPPCDGLSEVHGNASVSAIAQQQLVLAKEVVADVPALALNSPEQSAALSVEPRQAHDEGLLGPDHQRMAWLEANSAALEQRVGHLEQALATQHEALTLRDAMASVQTTESAWRHDIVMHAFGELLGDVARQGMLTVATVERRHQARRDDDAVQHARLAQQHAALQDDLVAAQVAHNAATSDVRSLQSENERLERELRAARDAQQRLNATVVGLERAAQQRRLQEDELASTREDNRRLVEKCAEVEGMMTSRLDDVRQQLRRDAARAQEDAKEAQRRMAEIIETKNKVITSMQRDIFSLRHEVRCEREKRVMNVSAECQTDDALPMASPLTPSTTAGPSPLHTTQAVEVAGIESVDIAFEYPVKDATRTVPMKASAPKEQRSVGRAPPSRIAHMSRDALSSGAALLGSRSPMSSVLTPTNSSEVAPTADPGFPVARVVDVDLQTLMPTRQRVVSASRCPPEFYMQQCSLAAHKPNKELLGSLPSDPSQVRVIDVSANYIGRRAIRSVVDLLLICRCVVTVNLADNRLDSECCAYVLGAAANHPTLETVIFDGNLISGPGGRALLKLAQDNKAITKISLLNNPLLMPSTIARIDEVCRSKGADVP